MATTGTAAGKAVSSDSEQNPGQKIVVVNKHGEKLVGLLHETGSNEIVVLYHGFQSSKESSTIMILAYALEKEGITAFRFDFTGNRESEGTFQYGNYRREADDLHSVIQHFHEANRVTCAILGHSKGEVLYRVTEESLMDRLDTNMHEACLQIDKDCKVLTVHGSNDSVVRVEEAMGFAKVIPNHKLHIIEGVDHRFSEHRDELGSIVLSFIKEPLNQ